MFISNKHSLVFFEVPRTGSNSVTAALTLLDPDSPTVASRQDGKRFHDYHRFEVPTHQTYSIVAAHRNPYDRLWSFWKYRHQTGNPEIFKQTSWQRYLEWACDPSSAPEITEAGLDIPINEMFENDSVDYWLNFEQLAQSWKEFGDQFNLSLPELGIQQSSNNRTDFRLAYNSNLASMVAERFAADFDRFGYPRNSWQI